MYIKFKRSETERHEFPILSKKHWRTQNSSSFQSLKPLCEYTAESLFRFSDFKPKLNHCSRTPEKWKLQEQVSSDESQLW